MFFRYQQFALGNDQSVVQIYFRPEGDTVNVGTGLGDSAKGGIGAKGDMHRTVYLFVLQNHAGYPRHGIGPDTQFPHRAGQGMIRNRLLHLGSLFSGHKLLGAVGSYIGIYIVEQIIMFLTIAITGNQDSTPTTIQLGIVKTEVEGLQLMNTTLAINIILTLVIMFVGFFVTKYIMTKKLNLQ